MPNHTAQTTQDQEQASYEQSYAWAKRHKLLSGKREHVQAAIDVDHAEAIDLDKDGIEWTARQVVAATARHDEVRLARLMRDLSPREVHQVRSALVAAVAQMDAELSSRF